MRTRDDGKEEDDEAARVARAFRRGKNCRDVREKLDDLRAGQEGGTREVLCSSKTEKETGREEDGEQRRRHRAYK